MAIDARAVLGSVAVVGATLLVVAGLFVVLVLRG
jgi:hypothetical protein